MLKTSVLPIDAEASSLLTEDILPEQEISITSTASPSAPVPATDTPASPTPDIETVATESIPEPLLASTVEVPTSAPAVNGKILAGALAGLTIPALFAAGGGKGGKGSDTSTQPQTETATTEKSSEQTTANNPVTNSQTAAKPTPVTENKAPEPAVKTDTAATEKPAVNKPVSDGQNAARPTVPTTENKTPAPVVKTDTAATEKPSEKPAVNKPVSDGQTAAKPTVPATENKTPAPAVKTDIAETEKPSEKPAVNKPVSDGQNAAKPTAPATENTTPAPTVKTDTAATEKPSETPAASNNQTIAPNDTPVQPEPVRYTSKFTLSNGLSFSIESENRAADISKQGYQDSVQPLKADSTTLNVLKFLAEKVDGSVVEMAYQPDSDGDGLIDGVDRYPNEWNVSDRDLREFASLAYAKENELEEAFASDTSTQSISINSIKTKFKDQVDISEYKQHWQVLKFVNGDDIGASGLDYTIFGNGKRWDGTYKNVVVAFRGSSNVGDWTANLKLASGFLPTQAKETIRILQELKAYNPEKIYSTGHSLGGYLAQFFASHSIQKSEFKDNFERSVLFNPAILKTGWFTLNSDLKNARKLTDEMVKEPVLDFSNKYSGKTTYKTVSYVVKNEAVSNLLGDYEPSIYMTDKVFDKSWGKHDLVNFYENSTQVQKYFSQGYRMDKNYQSIDTDRDGLTDYQELLIGTNPNRTDSDGDGFSDGIEVKLQADALDKNAIPERPESLYQHARVLELKASTQNSKDGDADEAVVLRAEVDKESGQVAYRADETAAAPWNSPLSAFGSTLIHGTAGNDTITGSHGRDKIHGGLGSDRLIGGEGADTFVFDATDLNGRDTDTIADFNTALDKLDLSGMKHLFADGREFDFNWSEVLVEGVQTKSNRAYLVFDEATQTLAYQAQGADSSSVFARFEGDQVQLNAVQIV